MKSIPFRFDAERHVYITLDTGEIVPNITRMLEAAGLIDSRWYTDEGCERGHEVHRLTADYDLGALDLADLAGSPYANYVQAHIAVMGIVRPTWQHIETPAVHKVHRYGGRPDRVGQVYAAGSVWEVKSGAPEPAHMIQTALQAILVAEELGLAPRAVQRFAEYVKADGKYKVEHHTNARDFDEAYRIIREFGRVAA